MSEQGTPVWHSIVGDGWEPVQFGQLTEREDQVLIARGWVDCESQNAGVTYIENSVMRPRRRRKPVQFSVVLRDKDGNQTAGGFVQAGKTYEVDALGQLIEVEVEE